MAEETTVVKNTGEATAPGTQVGKTDGKATAPSNHTPVDIREDFEISTDSQPHIELHEISDMSASDGGEKTTEEETRTASSESGETPATQAAAPGDPAPRHKNAEERIKALIEQREAAEQRAAELEQRLAQQGELKPDPVEEPQEPDPGAASPVTPPAIPTQESVNYDEDAYAAAMSEYQQKFTTYLTQISSAEIDKRLRKYAAEKAQAAQKEQEQQEQTNRVLKYRERARKFSEDHPDFDTIIKKDTPMHGEVINYIQCAETGPALAYELAKDPELCARLMRLTPINALVEVGKFEAATFAATSKKQVSGAPTPIEPIESSGGSHQPTDLDKLSTADYFKKRSAEIYGNFGVS